MRVVSHRTLYEDARFHAAFPSLARLSDGHLLLAFRRGRDPRWLLGDSASGSGIGRSHWDTRSHIATLRLSPDSLETMQVPTVVAPDPQAAEQDASLLVLESGRVLLGSFGWYPLASAAAPMVVAAMATGLSSDAVIATELTTFVPWGVSVRASDDGGSSFGAHHYLAPVPDSGDPWAERRGAYRGGLRGAMVEREGEVLLAAYDAVGLPASVHLFVSKDQGATFSHRACAIRDADRRAGFQEPSLLLTASGGLVLFCRTSGLGDALVTARSTDGGRSWSPWKRHSVMGHPYHPLRLRDGRVLLTYGYRHAPWGVRARLLDAEAGDLDGADEFVVRSDGEGADLGSPWAAELPGGEVVVAYYWASKSHGRAIVGTRITL